MKRDSEKDTRICTHMHAQTRMFTHTHILTHTLLHTRTHKGMAQIDKIVVPRDTFGVTKLVV